MNTRIKICGLTREQDVDAAVDAGVDAIGFVMYAPSPRAVSLQRALELSRRLPPFVTPVLLFVAQAILLDAHVEGFGGGGKTFNWSLLPPSVNAHLVLSGGLTPANVTDGILQVRPRGLSLAVDVSSGVEPMPGRPPLKGIKDAGKDPPVCRRRARG
jgi:phosphoribosylanthranilate isomerase